MQGGSVQVFAVGTLGFVGRSNLVTVTQFEHERTIALEGDALVAGFYVLELVTRLLDERQAEPDLFEATHLVLAQLAAGCDIQRGLRPFEMLLLDILGYGIDFRHDAESALPVEPNARYALRNEIGFTRTTDGNTGFAGELLLAIADNDYRDDRVVNAAKQMVRQRLAPLLGSKPLISRKMLVSPDS